MGHRLPRKTKALRIKMVFYAPDAVRRFLDTYAKTHELSRSEVIVRFIQQSFQFDIGRAKDDRF
jgi:hypothetical protein